MTLLASSNASKGGTKSSMTRAGASGWSTSIVGYHFHGHGHGAGSYPHRQGHGVPDGHQTYRLVELERDPVLWELVTIATRIDAEASGSLR